MRSTYRYIGQNVLRLNEKNRSKLRILKSFLLRSMASLLGQQGTIWKLSACLRRKNISIRDFITLLINKGKNHALILASSSSVCRQCMPLHGVYLVATQSSRQSPTICPFGIEKAELYSSRTMVYLGFFDFIPKES